MRRAIKRTLQRWVDGRLGPEDLERVRLLPTRQNAYGYDPFGFNRDAAKPMILLARFLYRSYFRCETFGLDNVPRGRVMLVANHSGQLPFDAVNIGAALMLDAKQPRMVRAMLERFVPTLPWISYVFARCGQVVGTAENCRRLLEDEEVLLVFPEGARGVLKPFTKRYQLQEFGSGFMRLALQTRTPIVPVAVVGAEEQAPGINIEWLAKLLGTPALPLMAVPPFVPALPLPSRYRLYFGDPRLFEGDPDDEEPKIQQLVKQVRLSIESMIQVGLRERKSIYF